MKNLLRVLFILGLFAVLSLPCLAVASTGDKSAGIEVKKIVAKPTADHRKFKQLKEEFKRGPEVTKACLSCHTEAAKQVHDTIHWTWGKQKKKQIHKLGKAYVLNSF